MTKPTKWHVRPAKTQISLGIRRVWSESSLCAQWLAKGPSFLHADSEYSDQTGRMPRLIWVFAGRTVTLLVLLCRGSFLFFRLSSRTIGNIDNRSSISAWVDYFYWRTTFFLRNCIRFLTGSDVFILIINKSTETRCVICLLSTKFFNVSLPWVV